MPTVSVSNRQDSKDIHKVTKIIIYCSSTSFISCNAVCYIQGKTRGAFAKKDNKDNQKHFNVVRYAMLDNIANGMIISRD